MSDLVDQLRLWADIKAQGISSEDVDSFGFEEKFLCKRDADLLRGKGERLPSGKYTCPVYNSVRLKNGTKRQLDPILRIPGKPWPILNAKLRCRV